MAVKLSSLVFSRRNPRRVLLNASLSSLSCAKDVEIYPQTDQSPPDFDSKIEILKNNLHPDTLVHALDSCSDVNSSFNLFKWASLQKRFKHNADTYHRMILKLGMCGNVVEMVGVCNEMVKANCPGSREVLLGLIDSFVKFKRFDEALQILFCLNSCKYIPSLGVFNVLMGELVKAKRDFKDVLFVYKEVVKARIVPDVETVNYLLEGLLEDDRIDMALSQYRRMSKKSCRPNSRTFEVLICGLIAKDQADEALVILHELLALDCELDLCFFNRVIPLLCSIHEFDTGMSLFMRMRDSEHSPDMSTYSVIIQGLCKNLLVDDAVKHLQEMIDGGLVPFEHVYVDIVSGFCELYRFEEAKNFLESYNIEEISPHNILLGAYRSARKFAVAKSLFYEMFERNTIDCLSWNILLECLCEIGELKKASVVLGRMLVAYFPANSAAYSALIAGKCRQDEYQDALKLFNQVQQRSWVLDSRCYAELVEYLCQKENVEEAVKVFCYMTSHTFPLHLNSLNVLVNGVCNTGDIKSAIYVIFLAHSCRISCSTATYNAIMRGLSKLESLDILLVMLSQMVVNGYCPNEETYCILIEHTSMFDQVEKCRWLFRLMLSQGLHPSSETLASLLACLGRHSQLHKILSVVDSLTSSSIDESNFNVLLSGLWKEGYKSEVSRYLDVMLDRGWVPDTTTHRLLMGSVSEEKTANENVFKHDEVTSILTEALTES